MQFKRNFLMLSLVSSLLCVAGQVGAQTRPPVIGDPICISSETPNPGTDVLFAGDSLYAGGPSKVARNGRYELVLQNDGNMVLYGESRQWVWQSGTYGQPAYRATMQSDGNFVIYNKEGRWLWQTHTYNSTTADGAPTRGAQLIISPKGHIEIFDVYGNSLSLINPWYTGRYNTDYKESMGACLPMRN
jgi:hypothetical protein